RGCGRDSGGGQQVLLRTFVDNVPTDLVAEHELIPDIASSVKSMQERVLVLCEQVGNEDLIMELLTVNDNLNDVQQRYITRLEQDPATPPSPAAVVEPPPPAVVPSPTIPKTGTAAPEMSCGMEMGENVESSTPFVSVGEMDTPSQQQPPKASLLPLSGRDGSPTIDAGAGPNFDMLNGDDSTTRTGTDPPPSFDAYDPHSESSVMDAVPISAMNLMVDSVMTPEAKGGAAGDGLGELTGILSDTIGSTTSTSPTLVPALVPPPPAAPPPELTRVPTVVNRLNSGQQQQFEAMEDDMFGL
ncbi:MAG TPA: hypothetical protein EYO33_29845, partial [Phycisphaerales bacterium]|nr:hypothetical protein [Phycisphaerales bacterium]